MNLIKDFSQRLVFVYLLILGIFLFGFHGREMIYKIRLQTLNRIRPETFQPLKETLDRQIPIDQKVLTDYIFYYEQIAGFVRPLSGDIFGILGYCYYLSGDIGKARASFEKAMTLSPNYFWYPYDLGLLALKKNDAAAASKYFKLAQKANTENTILSTVSSLQIYMPLTFKGYDEDMIQWLARRLDKGFYQNNVFLLYSYYLMGQDREQLKQTRYSQEVEALIQSGLNDIKIQVF